MPSRHFLWSARGLPRVKAGSRWLMRGWKKCSHMGSVISQMVGSVSGLALVWSILDVVWSGVSISGGGVFM
jgi:hypothetical protein